jgi:hypothetical protein
MCDMLFAAEKIRRAVIDFEVEKAEPGKSRNGGGSPVRRY